MIQLITAREEFLKIPVPVTASRQMQNSAFTLFYHIFCQDPLDALTPQIKSTLVPNHFVPETLTSGDGNATIQGEKQLRSVEFTGRSIHPVLKVRHL